MSTFLTLSKRPHELDGPTLIARLEAIRQYCKTLPFDHQFSWADVMFSGGLTSQALAKQFTEQRGELAPHQALLLAFLQAMQVPQALFNNLPKRHREFFYRDHLGFRERPAQPDHVNVVFALQPSVNELTLPAGLLLDAGNDPQGRPRCYQLEHPLSVNQGKLTDVRWVRQGEGLPRSFIAYDAKAQAQWPTDGLALFAPNAKDQVMSTALLIMDERLRLSSGMRFVSLQFDHPVIPLSAHISAEGKWQEMTVTIRDGGVTLSVAADAPAFTGASGLDGINSHLPSLKLTYSPHGAVPLVRKMQVFVKDSRAARVHTADGWFGNGEAFYPFGVQSQSQSRFTIVSDEWQAMTGVTVAMTPHWQTLQDQALRENSASGLLTQRVELSRVNSSPSMHELFRVSNTGVHAQSIKFQLKEEDLAQSTVVLDFTPLQPDAARREQHKEDVPQVGESLLWQRLQINWRSDPFPVTQQYLQHPFGYGGRSSFALEQEPAQLVEGLMQEPSKLAQLAQELTQEKVRLEQQARWAQFADRLAIRAQGMAQGLLLMVPYLQDLESSAQQLEQVAQHVQELEQLQDMGQQLVQQAQQAPELLRLAQLALELQHRAQVTRAQVVQLVASAQAFNAQMPFLDFVSEWAKGSVLREIPEILGLGQQLTLGEMYERGLLQSVLAQMIYDQQSLQRQKGQEEQRFSPLEQVIEALEQEPLGTSFWSLVPGITVAQIADLPFSQEGHSALLTFFELVIALVESGSKPKPEQIQALFATQLAGMSQDIFGRREQWFSHDGLRTAQTMHWFLRTVGRNVIHTLYLGFSNLKAGQTTALNWSLKEAASRAVQWSYLTSDGWCPLELEMDQTAQLGRSGLMAYTLPMDAANHTTLMPAGRHWLKARVASRAGSPSTWLQGIETNCASASLVDAAEVAAEHFLTPLPAGTITHTIETVPGLASVKQPWASSGGCGPESADAFDQRVAQQLSHRGRAVSWKDVQALLLEHFTSVHSVKLPDPGTSGSRPPQQIVVVPAHGHADNADPLRPLFAAERLKEMSKHLQGLSSPWLQVRLANPKYQDVFVDYQVTYAPGFSALQGDKLLRQALQRRYLPWTQSDRAEVLLGQELNYYDVVNFIQGHEFVQRVTYLTFNGGRDSVLSAADTVLILQWSGAQVLLTPAQLQKGEVV